MKKRLPIALVLVILLTALVVWLEPTRLLWGTLRGDAFFKGRPASYWARQVERWTEAGERCLGVSDHVRLSDQAMDYLGLLDRHPPRPTVLDQDPAALAVLTELLDCDHSSVRYHAVHALGARECWPEDMGTPLLRAALAHRRADVRWWAAVLLVRNGDREDLDRVIPVLIEAAQLADYYDRLPAIEALETIGPPARAAAAPLLAIQDQAFGPELRAATEKALARIGPEPAAAKADIR